jgi:hypothetical protein
MRHITKAVLVAAVVLSPAIAHAQATLAGTLRDASGGVLPGVTVEASSPALLEKARSSVTDSSGQYNIPSLPPGTYSVSFQLPGFNTVVRPGIEIFGAGVITVNAEMRVGGVQETITVTGESPVVDVQSTRRETVLDDSVVSAIPASRGYNAILTAVPSVTGGSQNIDLNPTMRIFTSHGGRGNEGRVQVDGLNVGAAFNGGGVSGFTMDTGNAAELNFTISGGLGEAETGGINLNIVPKTGGNSFSGTLFTSFAGNWSQGTNLDEELESFGLTEPADLYKVWDYSASFGGPIVRDRLWFFGSYRDFGTHQAAPGVFGNANAGLPLSDPRAFTYVRDESVAGRNVSGKTIATGRVTAQISDRNKVGFYIDSQWNCSQTPYQMNATDACRQRETEWMGSGFGNQSVEAAALYQDGYERVTQFTWSSPVTNKLLLEAGESTYISRWGWMDPPGAIKDRPQAALGSAFGTTYNGIDNYFRNYQSPNVWRASASYVTGAHSMKFGYQGAHLIEETNDFANTTGLTYVMNTASNTAGHARPSSLTMRIAPTEMSNRTQYASFYAQDQWTFSRLTLQGAVRYDRAWSWYTDTKNGAPQAGPFNPAPITFAGGPMVDSYNDITPRLGAAWDVRGDGRTSVRVNLGKYLQSANNQENYTIANPALDGRNGRRGPTFHTTTTRDWIDNDDDYVPDCDLMNPAAQGPLTTGSIDNCGAWSDLSFGNPSANTRINPDVLKGWGVRPYDWQFGISVQQEIFPRTSIEVGYHRRWFGNFFYTDNQALLPSDFSSATFNAPSNPRLPDGGGYPVTVYDINPVLHDGRPGFGQNRLADGSSALYYTFGSDLGDESAYWQGVDVTINARLANGLVFQGGTSTGRGSRDQCEIWAAAPELFTPFVGTRQQYDACSWTEPWLTQFRGLATYTIPKIDVLVSGVFQFKPNATTGPTDTTVATNGTSLASNYNVTNAEIAPDLERPFTGTAPTPTAFRTVNILVPGQLYAERINQVDLRVAKVLRFGSNRLNVGFDLYNLFNANPGLTFNQAYSDPTVTTGANAWLAPQTYLNARFIRFNATFDF